MKDKIKDELLNYLSEQGFGKDEIGVALLSGIVDYIDQLTKEQPELKYIKPTPISSIKVTAKVNRLLNKQSNLPSDEGITTEEYFMSETVSAVKAGRCYNGAHRDRGRIVHAVPPLPETSGGCWFSKAVCGAQPSGRSYGWDNTALEINCPKCLKKINDR